MALFHIDTLYASTDNLTKTYESMIYVDIKKLKDKTQLYLKNLRNLIQKHCWLRKLYFTFIFSFTGKMCKLIFIILLSVDKMLKILINQISMKKGIFSQ